jgi:hypothetical protein
MRVWYAAYGSNLHRGRFQHYLDRARDGSTPAEEAATTVAHQLRFERDSSVWCGGVAFLDPAPASGVALVRLWSVSVEQFEDVLAQENRLGPGEVSVDWIDLEAEGHHDIEGGWYRRVLWCGRWAQDPVVTFTCDRVAAPTPPRPDYLAHLLSGLRSSHGIDATAAAAYLLAAPGVAEAFALGDIDSLDVEGA